MITDNVCESHQLVGKLGRLDTEHTVWFYLFEVLEQTKLIYDETRVSGKMEKFCF